jgi:UDP-N-acetyl-2-amino-2-deoxyglucuronate dehydrogenase
MTRNFAITGVAGFVAPRHLAAIAATGNRLVAAADPHDSVGILDRHGFECRYFKEIERFDRHLEKLKRGPEEGRVHWLSICSPNFLHDAHIRLALRIGADALCEKPIVISPWNLDALQALEVETGKRVFTIMQLRLHPVLRELRERLRAEGKTGHEVELSYVTARGKWYQVSWKGNEEQSGGVATNIGIHLFDLMLWLFGNVERSDVHVHEAQRMAGSLTLERARVRWFLSVDPADLPESVRAKHDVTFRSLRVDGAEVEFSKGFTELHTEMYRETLAGRGFGIDVARPSVELSYRMRQSPLAPVAADAHPFVNRAR